MTQADLARRPPGRTVGPLALARANLFSTPGSAVLTLCVVALAAWTLPGVVRWAALDAVWRA
ncbi:MAG: amino acid ABC transporter permease, partial [Hyphomicrobiales bacterium]|nr:amino acid ABC transporter permease [Hyphomicrobiales bacterium]